MLPTVLAGERRLPFEPLRHHIVDGCGLNFEQVADITGLGRATFHTYSHKGVPMSRADRIACRLGVHPDTIWPDFSRLPHHPRELVETPQLFDPDADT